MEQLNQPPIKRGPGRPRKSLTEISARSLERRSAEERERARVEKGRLLDEQLKAEVKSLRAELGNYSRHEIVHLEEFLDQGYRLLRSIGYDLKSIQMKEREDLEEIWESESLLPSDQQIHMGGFVDAQANDMVFHCHQVDYLTPALMKFEIKVLEAVLKWADQHPENFEHRSALENELVARKRNVEM